MRELVKTQVFAFTKAKKGGGGYENGIHISEVMHPIKTVRRSIEWVPPRGVGAIDNTQRAGGCATDRARKAVKRSNVSPFLRGVLCSLGTLKRSKQAPPPNGGRKGRGETWGRSPPG